MNYSYMQLGPVSPVKALKVRSMRYCVPKPLPLMRDFSAAVPFFAISCGMSLLIGASFMRTPPPAKDALAYDKCVELHPVRYCSIVHLGAK
jgi:hypothetical protein